MSEFSNEIGQRPAPGTRSTCDPELLRRSLGDSLPEKQEEELTRHLSECPACQRELERLAAEQTEWSKVGSALKRESETGASNAHLSVEGASACREGADASADFAVDFLEPSPCPEAIGRLADIDILEVIGRGGMGIVLKGFQGELKRIVAVKVLAPHLAVSGAARARFAREAQATAAIMHPNVMPIFTVHSTGKLPFLVMPCVACESLEQRISREGPLRLPDLLRIGTQAARGLAAAHAQGLVHRDVKPANILLEKGVERVMLTDFGLARAVDDASLTRTGVIAGTPQFMSPEQARGDAIDARSDLFSLGSVLYAMATGRPPFRAETSFGILRRITDAPARPVRELRPEIPDWLAGIVERLHAKDPADRFGSAEEVANLLEACLAHVQQPTAAPLPFAARPSRSGKSVRRRRMAIAAAIVSALVLLGLVARLLIFNERGVARSVAQPIGRGPGEESRPAGAPMAAPNARAAPLHANAPGWGWRDEIPQEIFQSQRDIERLERETNQFWGRNQPSAAGTSPRRNETKRHGADQ
jgi:Protein kinase domain